MAIEREDQVFQTLFETIQEQQRLISSIADKLQKIENIGNDNTNTPVNGSATIADYASNQHYARNTLVVDTATETVYRVLAEYTSVTVEQDCADGNLKLVGYESQFIAFNGKPTQSQINTLPADTLVAIYSSADTPYQPELLE